MSAAPAMPRPRPGPALLLAALLVALAAAGCAPERPADQELENIRDERHEIAHPAKVGAVATGIGCAPTRKEALTIARRVAQFNLRGLTGRARYVVQFRFLRRLPDPQRVCVEVSARAQAVGG